MTRKFARGLKALIRLEDMDGLTFVMHGSPRAPLRRLWHLTIFAATIIGMVIGLVLGVATGHLLYYFFKETLNGIIGGIFAPFFLLLGWRTCRLFRSQMMVYIVEEAEKN